MSGTITWLHISDLHAGKPGVDWDAKRVLKTLITDLKQMASDHKLRPDFIFFTGDAAWGQIGSHGNQTLSSQFKIAGQFFKEVRQAFTPEIPVANLFLAPGNHDVNRRVVTESQTSWLDAQEDPTKITEIIVNGNKSPEWRRYMERLSVYRTFLKANNCGHLLGDPDRLVYHVPRPTEAGVDVCIGGFNTVWSCCRKKEKSLLWMGSRWQTEQLDFVLGKSEVSIVLMHHPPDWLTDWESSEFARDLEQRFLFALHGHEHDAWVTTSDKGHTRIAAGACYNRSDKENGYNFVRLDLESGAGEVWLRGYEPKGGGWGPRFVKGKTDDHGRWPLTHLSWLKSLRDSPAPLYPPGDGEHRQSVPGAAILYPSERGARDAESSDGLEPQKLPELPGIPEPLKWGRMENTIRNEINELRVTVGKKPVLGKRDFARKYEDVQRNILALAVRVTDDARHSLSCNWMDIKEDKNGRFLEVSTHQGFYSYLHKRRTFKLSGQGSKGREGGSCGWAFAQATVYLSPDTWNDPLIYFSETIPGEKLTLRSVINVPIPTIEEGVPYKEAEVEKAIKQGSRLPHQDIGAVLNIDSPFANIFSLELLAPRITRLILLGGLLLGVRKQYEDPKSA
jgi:predicted MPP superfamily phosphohydrolase